MPDFGLPSSLGLPGPKMVARLNELWVPDPRENLGLNQILPLFNYDMPHIEWDEYAQERGLTPAHALGADVASTILEALKTYRESPFYWREEGWLQESDLLNVRMMGSLNPKAGEQYFMRLMRRMNIRLDSRLEWLVWQALSGSLAINENGVKRTVTYAIQTPSAPSVTWDNIATANPMSDLATWLGNYDGVSAGNVSVYYGRDVANALANNARILNASAASGFAKQVSPANVGQAILSSFTDIERLQLYKGGYVDSAGTFQRYVPAKCIIMVADAPMGQPIGNVVSTLAVQNGGLGTPKSGRYSFPIDELQRKGKYGCQVGINAMPVLHNPKLIQKVQVLA